MAVQLVSDHEEADNKMFVTKESIVSSSIFSGPPCNNFGSRLALERIHAIYPRDHKKSLIKSLQVIASVPLDVIR